MALVPWASIVIAVISSLLTAGFLGFVAYARRRWKKQDNKHELYFMKMDSMIYALCSINHGIGDEFKKYYNEKLVELKVDKKFIEEAKN